MPSKTSDRIGFGQDVDRTALGDVDWVECEPKWWWKYVFPVEINFWAGILRQQGPVPDTWKKFTREILEGLVMVQAAVNVGDPQIRARLYQEGVATVSEGADSPANAKSRLCDAGIHNPAN